MRFRIRTLMAIVALVAIGLAIYQMRQRWPEYRALAEFYAAEEQRHMDSVRIAEDGAAQLRSIVKETQDDLDDIVHKHDDVAYPKQLHIDTMMSRVKANQHVVDQYEEMARQSRRQAAEAAQQKRYWLSRW